VGHSSTVDASGQVGGGLALVQRVIGQCGGMRLLDESQEGFEGVRAAVGSARLIRGRWRWSARGGESVMVCSEGCREKTADVQY